MLRLRLLDATQYHDIAAVACFAAIIRCGAAAVFGWSQPTLLTALALAALVGWLGQSMIGYLYNIVPFLLWHGRYGPLVGRQKVPLMRELLHERWAWLSWWLINVGLLEAVLFALFAWLVPMQLTAGTLATGLVIAAGDAWDAFQGIPHTLAQRLVHRAAGRRQGHHDGDIAKIIGSL